VKSFRNLWPVAALLGLTWLPCIAHAQQYEPPFNLKTPAIIVEGQVLFNRRCAGRNGDLRLRGNGSRHVPI